MIRVDLARIEAIVTDPDLARRIESVEALLPVGVRPRQLSVRTLLIGILVALCDGRPGHLVRVHEALVGLEATTRRRLGVVVQWRSGDHALTYRQVERTYRLLGQALSKETRDGSPRGALQALVDALLEVSVPERHKDASSSYAIDWTDQESFARPVPAGETSAVDPEASWGHRSAAVGCTEMFFGYYLSIATMVRDEGAAPVPELARRMLVAATNVDPVPAMLPVLTSMVDSGVAVGDAVYDSGYSHRVPEHWALPLRAKGAHLVTDLHPGDRGFQGTHEGAICWNGNLYCPATPKALFDLQPLGRGASHEQTAAHDARSAELARYKLGRQTADDADGYHRVKCPATAGKVRCPLRAGSMALSHEHPEILTVPEEPPRCCTQVTITVPPSVNAKTAQKHDYPSKEHRDSYARRSAAERTNATVKDPASTDLARGWCRVMGLAPITVLIACALVVRNLRVIDAFEARQREAECRLAAGREPQVRRRRRTTLGDLAGTAAANAPP